MSTKIHQCLTNRQFIVLNCEYVREQSAFVVTLRSSPRCFEASGKSQRKKRIARRLSPSRISSFSLQRGRLAQFVFFPAERDPFEFFYLRSSSLLSIGCPLYYSRLLKVFLSKSIECPSLSHLREPSLSCLRVPGRALRSCCSKTLALFASIIELIYYAYE